MQSRNRNRRRYRGGYLANDVVYATVIWSLAGMAGILAAIWLFTIAIRSETLLNSETEVARLNSLFTDEAAAASAIVIPTGATCTGGGVFEANPSNTPDYTYEPSDGAYANPTYSPTATCNQLLVYVRHPGTPGAANPRANDRYLLASFANGLLTISSASSVGTNQEPINPTVLQTIPVESFAVHAVPTTEFANPNDLFTTENEAFLANNKGAFAGNMASVFASIEAHGLHPSVHTVRYAVPNTILTASNTGYFIFGEFNKNKTEPFFGLYGTTRLPATGVIDAIGTFTPPPQSNVTLGSAGLLYFGKPGIAARALTIAEQNYHGYWEVPPSGVACAGGTTGSGGGSITQYVPPYPTGAPYPGASPLPTPPQPRPYAYPAPNDASTQNAPANLLIAPAQPGMCQANLLSVYGTTLLPAYIVSAPLAASSANLGTLAKTGAVATLTKLNDGFPINASVTAWSPASCASAITATAGANTYSNGAWPATPPAPNQTYAANGLLTVTQPLPPTTSASQGMTFTPTGTTSAALACTATVQTTDHDGTVERTTIAMTAPATVTAMLTWPAGGIVEAASGSTLAMLPMHEPLIAKLFGAEMADALTTGCEAVVIASGTFPVDASGTAYTPASLSQLPPAAQTLLSGQGYTVDGTGCVWQNGALAAQAPIVAYEPGDSSPNTPTYNPTTQCAAISLGQVNPTNASGPQILVPVIPGSTAGSCTVTIAASPAPSGTPGPGSGLVPVGVVKPVCTPDAY
ncbi:MAG: hypothetical protein HKL92_10195, partial [Candidatus Eremiobacteraeota bacterium]|nr:hypothetical protein [Candidatus Eremiobacteraeota bacterium]